VISESNSRPISEKRASSARNYTKKPKDKAYISCGHHITPQHTFKGIAAGEAAISELLHRRSISQSSKQQTPSIQEPRIYIDLAHRSHNALHPCIRLQPTRIRSASNPQAPSHETCNQAKPKAQHGIHDRNGYHIHDVDLERSNSN